ncbi:MAG: hypothetical protein IJ514_07975 [Clostridia bacterium]|nr:hypothetical protein [Clostridia bacterium]
MSRSSKGKNGKVPKITEEEYAAYLSALKTSGENEAQPMPQQTGKEPSRNETING